MYGGTAARPADSSPEDDRERVEGSALDDRLVFRPRPSYGYLWLGGIALLVLLVAGLPALLIYPAAPLAAAVNATVALAISVPLLALVAWFPSMRYELDRELLTLRYGPVLTYRIPLVDIDGIERRDLSPSLMSSVRLPGLALFAVQYTEVGSVRMCATRAARGILLVHTRTGLYGLTPRDEEMFIAAVQERLDR